MKIYIAAPYPERELALNVMRDVLSRGHEVTSRWLTDPNHVLLSQEQNAINDRDDVRAADLLLALNPPGYENKGTGGRHHEFGIACTLNKIVVLCGDRTNVFHHLPEVEQYINYATFCFQWQHYEERTRKKRAGDQPLPITNDLPRCHDMQLEALRVRCESDLNDYQELLAQLDSDVRRRLAIGIQRYGTPLQPFNGRSFLRDLYEELLDAHVYAHGVEYEAQHTQENARLIRPDHVLYYREKVEAFILLVRRALNKEELQHDARR